MTFKVLRKCKVAMAICYWALTQYNWNLARTLGLEEVSDCMRFGPRYGGMAVGDGLTMHGVLMRK